MKRLIALLLIFLLPVTALAASKTRTKWTDVPEVVRPGKAARMTFYCPVKTTATVTLLNAQGKTVATLCEDMQTVVGENELTWDGTADGEDVTPGTYTLRIALSGKRRRLISRWGRMPRSCWMWTAMCIWKRAGRCMWTAPRRERSSCC